MGNGAVMITPAQCRAARAWLNMTQEELARLAVCATSVVVRFERGQVQTVRAIVESIQRVLEGRGIAFSNVTSHDRNDRGTVEGPT